MHEALGSQETRPHRHHRTRDQRHVGALFLALPWVCRQVDGLWAHKRSSAAGTVEKEDGYHDGRDQDGEQ